MAQIPSITPFRLIAQPEHRHKGQGLSQPPFALSFSFESPQALICRTASCQLRDSHIQRYITKKKNNKPVAVARPIHTATEVLRSSEWC